MLEFSRTGEKDDANGEDEGGQRGDQSKDESEESTAFVWLMVAWKGNGLRLMPPLKGQKPERQQEKQKDKWMGEEHGGLGSVGREKLFEILGREIGIGSVKPFFQLKNQRRGFGVGAKLAKDFGGVLIRDFGKTFAPMADKKPFELGLLIGGEFFGRGFLDEGSEAFGDARWWS